MPQDKKEMLNDFVDDRTLHTTISDIEERIDSTFENVPKYGPESGDLTVANFVWETDLPAGGTITVNPEKDDGVVQLHVHLREDSAAASVVYPVGYHGSCVFIGSPTDVLEAVREVADWEETTSVDGGVLSCPLK
ncbi:hypothetical protein [Natrinema sp. 1APR25-10V2]|uniref:hypothetical protein n=1 Tax=Natrinema sp. 1APR25-10V2 TaxID=2951081 RepID=UPI0028743620|nr:hypothetical protein [Natrinema sp. 1APR25-10V2]MDS0473509.1 hypothetical protein [Natrinema sp. 1APR25-10V2]